MRSAASSAIPSPSSAASSPSRAASIRSYAAPKSDPELLRLLCGYAMGFATYEQLRRHMARVVMPQWVWGKVRSFVGA